MSFPAWMTSSRWSVSHVVKDGEVTFIGAATETYRMTACGRRVRVERLEPEPTGIDTIHRCPKCLVHAPNHGLGATP